MSRVIGWLGQGLAQSFRLEAAAAADALCRHVLRSTLGQNNSFRFDFNIRTPDDKHNSSSFDLTF